MDISTETLVGRPSTCATAPPSSSTRFAIAPLANFPVLSCTYKPNILHNLKNLQSKKKEKKKKKTEQRMPKEVYICPTRYFCIGG